MMLKVTCAACLAATVFTSAVWAETGRVGRPGPSAEALATAQSTYIFTFGENVRASDVASLAQNGARMVNGRVDRIYTSAIKGFSARMNAVAAENLRRRMPQIVAVEQDQIYSTLETQVGEAAPGVASVGTTTGTLPTSGSAPWGTVRVKGQLCGLPYSRVWIIDTGIDLTHPNLRIASTDLHLPYQGSAVDRNGHGTHVAGTVGAIPAGTSARGVAPGVPVVPVRVLGDDGFGTLSSVIAGVDHVARKKDEACGILPVGTALARTEWCDRPEAWVANMSLGGGYSLAINTAVINAARKGVRFAIAAGNDSRDARNYSPASANHENIFTVASMTSSDRWSSFSNFGPPVDVAAPGSSISSTYPPSRYATLSGTSMAAPHMAAILAMAPSMKSNPAVGALTVGNVSYTDRTVMRNTRDVYRIAAYMGGAPQAVATVADCKYGPAPNP